MEMTVEILQARIQLLENENRRLKERLEEAGISCTDIENYALDSNSALYDPDQGGRIKPIDVTNKVAETFFELFCRGRRDVYEFTIFSAGVAVGRFLSCNQKDRH